MFIENRSGTLVKVLDLFKEAGIQLIASTISDTVEYGIFRIICSEPMKGIGISYMYSFMLSGKGILIFRTDDPERTKEVIRVNGIESLNDESLLSLV